MFDVVASNVEATTQTNGLYMDSERDSLFLILKKNIILNYFLKLNYIFYWSYKLF